MVGVGEGSKAEGGILYCHAVPGQVQQSFGGFRKPLEASRGVPCLPEVGLPQCCHWLLATEGEVWPQAGTKEGFQKGSKTFGQVYYHSWRSLSWLPRGPKAEAARRLVRKVLLSTRLEGMAVTRWMQRR